MAILYIDPIIIQKYIINTFCYKQGIDFFLDYPFTENIAKQKSFVINRILPLDKSSNTEEKFVNVISEH